MANLETGVLFGCFEGSGKCAGKICYDGCESPVFRVSDKPVIIRAYNLQGDEKIFLEQVSAEDPEAYAELVKKGCGCCVVLTAESNSLVVAESGLYRLNQCVCDNTATPTGSPHVEYAEIDTGVTINLGDSGMSNCCGTDIVVAQSGDQTIITLEGETYVVPHGISDVSTQTPITGDGTPGNPITADLSGYMTTADHNASLEPVYGNDGSTVLFNAHTA